MGSELIDDPYGDGTLYDLEYSHQEEDIDWYVLQARQGGGPVLELGCGTGRLTLPIARGGVSVVGMDRAAAMLRTLEHKLEVEDPVVKERVRLVEGDYRTGDPGGPFVTVLWPFNALHHCEGPEEVVAVLRRALAWTGGSGRLVVDCYLPDLELYDRDPNTRYEPRDFIDPRSGNRLESWEQGWWEDDKRVHHVLYVYRHPDGRQERSHLKLRMYELPELRALFAAAGWQLVQETQDFLGSSVDDGALKWVGVATPAP